MWKTKLRKPMFFTLGMVSAAAVAAYWFNQNPPGVTIVNPRRPPEPILAAEEVDKIRTLQTTREVFLLGGMSPDDRSILVVAGVSEESLQVSWLDLQTETFEPIDSKVLELFPQGEIAWSDDHTAIYLSSNASGKCAYVTRWPFYGKAWGRKAG